MGEEKRHQMMQNLFGDQSEEEGEGEEMDSEHESNPQSGYASEEGVEPEGQGEAEIEGHEEAVIESEGELHGVDLDPGESEGERDQNSQEEVGSDGKEENEGKDIDSDEKEEYGQREVTSRRRDVVESGTETERSKGNHYLDNDDKEVEQAKSPGYILCFLLSAYLSVCCSKRVSKSTLLFLHPSLVNAFQHIYFFLLILRLGSKSPRKERDQTHISHSAAEIQDVFGDSDDEAAAEYVFRNDIEEDSNISPTEEEGSYMKSLRPEDVLDDEDAHYESEEDNFEANTKEKPVGPPLEIGIPLHPPPAHPTKMHMIKVSNIMGIDPKPFDRKMYVEDDTFVTDESGSKKRIRLENNIVHWRTVRNPNGTTSYESNARFVRWSDGSLQLLIGNEVLDISVQDAHMIKRTFF